MTPAPLRIGDPVRVHAETEVLTLVAIDGEYAWVRDGAGRPQTRPLADLVRARSKSDTTRAAFRWHMIEEFME